MLLTHCMYFLKTIKYIKKVIKENGFLSILGGNLLLNNLFKKDKNEIEITCS